MLLTKGADSIIEKRLKNIQGKLKNETNNHLQAYAQIGLRTLLLAQRYIPRNQYTSWLSRYTEAMKALKDRDRIMEEMQNELEIDLEIVGATAIEDKLQPDVGQTIERIKATGIKFWVLTGDKVETAINIGVSCCLINERMGEIIVDSGEENQIRNQINTANELSKQEGEYAFIITGDALIYAMNQKSLQQSILEIAKRCSAVLCCRVSPKQKQEIVTLVRDNTNATTLAIGDGANDVNMITAAHVGIGIKGVEGAQAARASDYAVGEFRALQRLVLYYGRESYRKNSYLILYNFFKNMILVFPQFWIAFLNGFSAQNQYDPFIFQLYNICYSSFPIIIYALFDEEFQDEILLQTPFLYLQGMKDKLFNSKSFWLSMTNGSILFILFNSIRMWQAAFITFAAFFSIGNMMLSDQGSTASFWAMLFLIQFNSFFSGMIVFTGVVYNTNLKIFLFSYSFSPLSLLIVILSIVFYIFNYWLVSNYIHTFDIYSCFSVTFSSITFWLLVLLTITGTNLIDLAFSRFYDFSKYEFFQVKTKGIYNQLIEQPENGDIQLGIHQQYLDDNQAIISRPAGTYGSQGLQRTLTKKRYFFIIQILQDTGFAFSQEEPLTQFQKTIQN